ncbi:MAG: Hpt domain-containing protein, partial [Pseudomonadota bacterium]|nr:Hpt domain-containing protein [Pseudomonadota bacterium]
NNAFDTMTNGDERKSFNIDPDAVDRAQEIVVSLFDEYLQWLSADIDEIENSLPKAYKNPQRVDQLRRKAHDIRGQGGSFGFPLVPRLADGLHLVMVSQDGPLSRGGADLTRGLFAAMRIVVERRASGTRRRAKLPMTQFLKSKFVMTDRDAEYH